MITTRDRQVAARLRRLRQHAMTLSDIARHSSHKVVIESYDEIGFNYRMTDLQAAIGLVQLERLDQMIARRRQLAARYSSRLSALEWLKLPAEVPGTSRHNYQSYMVRLNRDAQVSRDELMQAMLDRGVSLRRGVMAIHREPPYRTDHWDRHLQITDAVSRSTVMLPLFHDMTEDDQDYVIESLKGVAETCYT